MTAIRHPALKSFPSDKAPSVTSFLILFESFLAHLPFNAGCQKQSLLFSICVSRLLTAPKRRFSDRNLGRCRRGVSEPPPGWQRGWGCPGLGWGASAALCHRDLSQPQPALGGVAACGGFVCRAQEGSLFNSKGNGAHPLPPTA